MVVVSIIYIGRCLTFISIDGFPACAFAAPSRVTDVVLPVQVFVIRGALQLRAVIIGDVHILIADVVFHVQDVIRRAVMINVRHLLDAVVDEQP